MLDIPTYVSIFLGMSKLSDVARQLYLLEIAEKPSLFKGNTGVQKKSLLSWS